MRVARPVGQNLNDTVGRENVGGRREHLLRCLVHPVRVLIDEDLGTHLSGPDQEPTQRIEHHLAALLGVHREDRLISRIYREQIAEVGESRPEILAEAEDAPVKLRHDSLFAISLFDSEIALEQVDERMKGDSSPEGHAMPFEPSHILTEAPAEFEGEAGLSDPRVSHEENDLPVASLGLFKTLGEKPELALSADEEREPALGLPLQTRPVCPSGGDLPGGDRFSLSLDGNPAQRAGEEVSVDQAVGGLGDDYPLR